MHETVSAISSPCLDGQSIMDSVRFDVQPRQVQHVLHASTLWPPRRSLSWFVEPSCAPSYKLPARSSLRAFTEHQQNTLHLNSFPVGGSGLSAAQLRSIAR